MSTDIQTSKHLFSGCLCFFKKKEGEKEKTSVFRSLGCYIVITEYLEVLRGGGLVSDKRGTLTSLFWRVFRNTAGMAKSFSVRRVVQILLSCSATILRYAFRHPPRVPTFPCFLRQAFRRQERVPTEHSPQHGCAHWTMWMRQSRSAGSAVLAEYFVVCL